MPAKILNRRAYRKPSRKRSLMIVCGPPANAKRANKAIARMQFTIIGGKQVAVRAAQIIRSRAANERATRVSARKIYRKNRGLCELFKASFEHYQIIRAGNFKSGIFEAKF